MLLSRNACVNTRDTNGRTTNEIYRHSFIASYEEGLYDIGRKQTQSGLPIKFGH